MAVILGRSEAETRESLDDNPLVCEMVGASPTMTEARQKDASSIAA